MPYSLIVMPQREALAADRIPRAHGSQLDVSALEANCKSFRFSLRLLDSRFQVSGGRLHSKKISAGLDNSGSGYK